MLIFLLLILKGPLHILGNCPLLDMSFANISSQSMSCSLIVLILAFTEQKFFILMKSTLSIFSFKDCTFGVEMLSPYPSSPRFSPVLCYRSFPVSHFTFRFYF